MPGSGIWYDTILSELKAMKSWNRTPDEWIALPRWARKLMMAEYVASGDIAYWLAEDSKE